MGILLFVALSLAVSLAFACVHMRARKLSGDDWESIVARLQPIPFPALEKVALDHLQPHGGQLQLEPGEIWELVGGWDGLRRMRRNADLILQLAAYVRRWNFEESAIVAERIRQDSLMLKRALLRIELQVFGLHRFRTPFYVHQAASAYYLMARRLLALYETNQYVLYPRLASAF